MLLSVRRVLLATVITVVLAPNARGDSAVSMGIGAGTILHGGVGVDGFSSAGFATHAYFEYRGEREIGVRSEATWMSFRDNSPHIPPERGFRFLSEPVDRDLHLVGGSISFIRFSREGRWASSYFLFSAGGYRVVEDGFAQVAILMGPGLGIQLERGSAAIGAEVDLHLAFFESATMVMVPVKLYGVFTK